MELQDLVNRGNTLKVKCVITQSTLPHAVYMTPEIIMNGAAIFQVRMNSIKIMQNNNNTISTFGNFAAAGTLTTHTTLTNMIFVRFYKQSLDEDDLIYTIRLTCNEYSINNKCLTSDDGTWHLIHEATTSVTTIELDVIMDIFPKTTTFVHLQEDEELTDFKLVGKEGFVHVHRAVLAASSPVLHRMLCGTWKETKEGHVELPGISKTTLQYFKNFLYSHTLPNTRLEIENLLVLAAYYMIPVLEQKCVNVLVGSLTSQNAYDMLEFAMQNKVTRLTLAILQFIQTGEIPMKDIRKSALQNKHAKYH